MFDIGQRLRIDLADVDLLGSVVTVAVQALSFRAAFSGSITRSPPQLLQKARSWSRW